MKKSYLLIFVIGSLSFLNYQPLSAFAQENNSEISISVSAEVVSTIEMITIQSMNLTKEEAVNNRIQINPQPV